MTIPRTSPFADAADGSVVTARDAWRPAPALRDAAPAAALRIRLDYDRLLDNGIFGFESLDERAQPFALLRSMVLTRLGQIGGKVIAVTSTQASNGKSFVSANLAAALSQIHPVWLVDLDLQRPTAGKRFALPTCAGADDFLLGQASLSEVGCVVEGSRLTILPVRQGVNNSADLLASSRGTALFDQLRALPDRPVCIIDTPPILEGDESIIVARQVDGVLLVIEEGQTRQREVREALRMLKPTALIGTVLNKSISPPMTSGGYRNGGYRRAVRQEIKLKAIAAPRDWSGEP